MINYTANPYNPDKDYTLIQEGIYLARIIETQERMSQAGHNYYSMKFNIIGTEYDGRIVFNNINLNHPNDYPKVLAKRFLDGLGYAFNLAIIDDLNTLNGRDLKLHIIIDKNLSNTIIKVYKASDEPKLVIKNSEAVARPNTISTSQGKGIINNSEGKGFNVCNLKSKNNDTDDLPF